MGRRLVCSIDPNLCATGWFVSLRCPTSLRLPSPLDVSKPSIAAGFSLSSFNYSRGSSFSVLFHLHYQSDMFEEVVHGICFMCMKPSVSERFSLYPRFVRLVFYGWGLGRAWEGGAIPYPAMLLKLRTQHVSLSSRPLRVQLPSGFACVCRKSCSAASLRS